MVDTAMVLAISAMAMSILFGVYNNNEIQGVGNPEDFDNMLLLIEDNKQALNSGDNGIKTLYQAEDTLIRADITTLREELQKELQELRDRPTASDNTDDVVSVSSDLEFESYADAALSFQTGTFHQGDQITLRAYNDDLNDKATYYVTDPNGITTEPKILGTNQGYFQWLYQIPDFALTGAYIITLELGEKVDAIKISVVKE